MNECLQLIMDTCSLLEEVALAIRTQTLRFARKILDKLGQRDDVFAEALAMLVGHGGENLDIGNDIILSE